MEQMVVTSVFHNCMLDFSWGLIRLSFPPGTGHRMSVCVGGELYLCARLRGWSTILHSVFPGWCKDPFLLFFLCNANSKRKHASDPWICIAMDQVKIVAGRRVGEKRKKKKWRKVKPFHLVWCGPCSPSSWEPPASLGKVVKKNLCLLEVSVTIITVPTSIFSICPLLLEK